MHHHRTPHSVALSPVGGQFRIRGPPRGRTRRYAVRRALGALPRASSRVAEWSRVPLVGARCEPHSGERRWPRNESPPQSPSARPRAARRPRYLGPVFSLDRVRPKIGTREVRKDFPNFRDHGLRVDRPLLKIVRSNQRHWGHAALSEAMIRAMVVQDTGHCPGVNTIPKALRRLELDGQLECRWVEANGRHPNGGQVNFGILRIRVAKNSADARAIAGRAKHVDRRRGVDGHTVPMPRDFERALDKLAARSVARDGGPSPAVETRQDEAARRLRQLERAAELIDRWSIENPSDPDRPPAPGRPGLELDAR